MGTRTCLGFYFMYKDILVKQILLENLMNLIIPWITIWFDIQGIWFYIFVILTING